MPEKIELPRVLVGTPTYEGKEYCRKQFVQNVKNLSYKNYNFVIVDNSVGTSYAAKLRRDRNNVVRVDRGRNSRDALTNASNALRELALRGGYEYLLMLESDIFPKKDIIESLMRHMDVSSPSLRDGVRVVGAPYMISDGKTTHLCIFKTVLKNGVPGTEPLNPGDEQWFINGTVRLVHGMGVGCVLIHKSILEKFTFWYSELDDDRMAHLPIRKHPDVYFYLDLHNNRIPVFCDTSCFAEHHPSDWRLVKDI